MSEVRCGKIEGNTVRNILYEFKTLYLEHKETLGISEEYLCAFKDMCSDLDIGNWH